MIIVMTTCLFVRNKIFKSSVHNDIHVPVATSVGNSTYYYSNRHSQLGLHAFVK